MPFEFFGLEGWMIGASFGANVALSAGLVVASYWLIERRIAYGVVGGLVLAAAIVWVEATVGQQVITLTFEQRRTIIVMAGIGAAIGIVGSMTLLKPEVE